MFKSVKRIIIIFCISTCCCIFPTTGCRSFNFHQSDDEKWLIEQVEKGYLTQEEADQIRLEWKEDKEK